MRLKVHSEVLPGAGARTLCEAFQLALAHDPNATALRAYGARDAMTWQELDARVRSVAEGLASLGVGRGDTVAMMTRNIPEAVVVDVAALHLGATPFSIYPTSTPEQVAYLLANADSRVVVYEPQFAEAFEVVGRQECLHRVVIGDHSREHEITLDEIQGRTVPALDLDLTWRAVDPEDVAVLVYTSGTTGPPKGVQMTHGAILAELSSLSEALPCSAAGRVVSYLPFAHIGDRIASYYPALYCAHSLTMVSDPADALAAVVDTRPTQWSAVPRVWEKLMASLQSEGLEDPTALSEDDRAAVRESLGMDQVRWVASGAAPIARDVLDFFTSLGLPICETWGMSECAVGTVNPVDDIRAGSVGRVLPGMEYRLLADGELLLRGPTLMAGYRKDPAATELAIDPDGWLHTGDIVAVDEDGYITVVDRKKELIVSAGGKNMSPANIERCVKAASPLIAQVCAIGDRRAYNTALVVLDPQVASSFARQHGLVRSDLKTLSGDPVVGRHVEAAIAKGNEHLSRVEQIKKFTVLPVDWVASSDELTPTMKLRRREIAAKYADVIESMYVPGRSG